MSTAGKMRLSASLRTRLISMLPVPLNSSKMTSSIFEPVSMSAVATIVRLPPSSMLRAAPKKRFGRCSALVSKPPDRVRPVEGMTWFHARASRVIESSKNDDVVAEFDQSLAALERELGNCGVILGMLVEGGGDDLAFDRAAHVGDFFGSLVDEQRKEVAFGMIGRNGVGDFLEQGRLAGFGRRHNERPLPLADRTEQIEDASAHFERGRFHLQSRVWINRDELVEVCRAREAPLGLGR